MIISLIALATVNNSPVIEVATEATSKNVAPHAIHLELPAIDGKAEETQKSPRPKLIQSDEPVVEVAMERRIKY